MGSTKPLATHISILEFSGNKVSRSRRGGKSWSTAVHSLPDVSSGQKAHVGLQREDMLLCKMIRELTPYELVTQGAVQE